jgi:outer membrane receptor protein involved in Fe transport
MHRLFLSCLCFFYSFIAFAQTGSTVLIKGTVKDSTKQELLSYVTISVSNSKTGVPLLTVLTKENGNFQFSSKKDTALILEFVSIGYNNKKVVITPTGDSTDLGIILLSPYVGNLKDVVVTATATRPLIKQEADRIAYDVQTDPESKVNTVLDMLRKVPLVSVDGSDNIKLKGSSNYKILINGKPSSLVSSNPSDVFRSMPAINIIKIEVITTPPAKYDAEGLAGIINIITKKNVDEGYNGSVNTRYNSVWGPGVNLNATLKQGKIGLNGYVGYNRRNNQTVASGFANQIFQPVQSNVTQDGTRSNGGDNTYGNAELSYEIDTLNLLTSSVQFYNGKGNNSTDQLLRQLNGNNTLAQQYRQTASGNSNYHGIDLSLNYEKIFKRNKEQLLTTSYKYSQSGNTQNNGVLFFDRLNYTMPNFRQYNNSGTKEHTAQVDYVHPVKTLTIEGGAKAILRKNFSRFTTDYYMDAVKDFVNDPTQTNDFDYDQNVYSIYNSYGLKLKDFVMKAGLRLEHTTIDAQFASTNSSLKQSYNNLVPSVSMQRTLKNSNSITLGFSQRIQRPGIWQLNPFVNRANPKFINVGNPNLQPVVNRNIEITFSNFKKGSINPSISYFFANNTVESVTSVGADTVTTITYQNVGSNRGLSFNLNMNYPFTPKLTVNINAQLLHVWLKGTYNNQFYYNRGFQGHIFTYTTYKFNKGWRASVNLGFDSRYVLLQGRDNYYPSTSVSGSKTLWKEKGTISLNINNPYKKFFRLDFYTRSPDFYQTNYFENYFRSINISFNYKFGKLNSNIKKNQRGISNDDVNGGSRQ